MLEYTKEYFKKEFVANSHKDAYMKAIKWIASNVISDVELSKSKISFEKSENKEKQLPTIIIHLSVCLNEKEQRDKNCKICKEIHSNFFMNEETNCGWCKTVAYQKRLDENIKIKRSFYRERLGKKL